VADAREHVAARGPDALNDRFDECLVSPAGDRSGTRGDLPELRLAL